jgi:hypothetical protein
MLPQGGDDMEVDLRLRLSVGEEINLTSLSKDKRWISESWGDDPAFQLYFGKLIEIRKILPAPGLRTWRYTTFEGLLSKDDKGFMSAKRFYDNPHILRRHQRDSR